MHQIKHIAAAAIVGVLATLGAASSASANDFAWQFDAYNDPSNGGRYTANLTHGVPETDNVQFRATCTPRGQTAVLAYNYGNLPDGHQVLVGFYQNGREVYAKSGTVYHGAHSEDVAGILFRPDVNDGLWVTLQREGSIQYSLDGKPRARMHLRGSSNTIDQFTKSCGGILNASSGEDDDSDNEENNVASDSSCNAFGNLRSVNSQSPITIHFVNNSGAHRSVMWLDYEGQPKQYKDLAAGESYSQQTFAGHPWMFTDGPGNCKEIFIPRAGGPKRYSVNFAD